MPRTATATVTVLTAAALVAAAATPRPLQAQAATPEAAVEAYYAALAAADFRAVAALTHPSAIHRLRNDILVRAEGPGLPAALRGRLGVRGIEELRALPPAVFYQDLLTGFFPDPAPLIAGMAQVGVVVAAAAYEGEDRAHVVHTVTLPRPDGIVERTSTMAVGLDGAGWKVIPETVPGVHVTQTLGLPAVLFPYLPGQR
jgi:hypothetical protein